MNDTQDTEQTGQRQPIGFVNGRYVYSRDEAMVQFRELMEKWPLDPWSVRHEQACHSIISSDDYPPKDGTP